MLCIQEPELTLKRIAASALSDIPWGKNGQGSAQGKARFVLYEAAPAAAAVAAGVAAGQPSTSALCLRRHLFFVQHIRMTRNNVYGKLKVYLVNPRARHAVCGDVKLASLYEYFIGIVNVSLSYILIKLISSQVCFLHCCHDLYSNVSWFAKKQGCGVFACQIIFVSFVA